jgi:hypothetical protein
VKNGSMILTSMSGGPPPNGAFPPGMASPNEMMKRIMQDQQRRLQSPPGGMMPMSSPDSFTEAMQDPEIQGLLKVHQCIKRCRHCHPCLCHVGSSRPYYE